MQPRVRSLLFRVVPPLVGLALVVFALMVRSQPAERGKPPSGDGPSGGPPRTVSVQTIAVEQRDVPVWLEGLGTVAAFAQVTARPQVDGRLDKIFFREGQTVRKGELLAQIDPRPFAVQLHQAEGALARDRAQLQGAKLNLERYQTLVKDKLVAEQQQTDQVALVGQSEGAIRVDEAAVEAAKLNLDYAQIRAPFDGVVGVKLIDPGNLVRASDPTGVVVVTQLDPAAVLFTLPQDELPRVFAAMRRGDVVAEAWSRDGETLLGKGKLAVVDNQINQATSTLRLKALLPNGERKLWPNQFVKLRVLLEVQRAALVLPAAAVQRGPQGTFVYVAAKDNTAAMRPVEVGLTTGTSAVITKGVVAGEPVISEGQALLRPGAPIRARPAGRKP